MADINYNDDILDTRDLDERLEELEALEEALKDAEEELSEYEDDTDEDDTAGHTGERMDLVNALETAKEQFGDDERDELKMLREARDEVGSEWPHGETMIADSYFVQYAEQLADDIGAIDRNAGWPTCHIDWDAAAESLKQDYSYTELDGNKFWFRMS